MSEQEYVNQMIKTEEDKIGYEKFGMLWFVKGRIPDDVTPWPNDPSSPMAGGGQGGAQKEESK